MIGVDWGTSNLRAYRFDAAGQVVDHAASRAELVDAKGAVTPLKVGDDLLISAGSGPRPPQFDAPLVFIGYGLHLPKHGHDDFAGPDLKGKIAVMNSIFRSLPSLVPRSPGTRSTLIGGTASPSRTSVRV